MKLFKMIIKLKKQIEKKKNYQKKLMNKRKN